jgi:hypothetical protein
MHCCFMFSMIRSHEASFFFFFFMDYIIFLLGFICLKINHVGPTNLMVNFRASD